MCRCSPPGLQIADSTADASVGTVGAGNPTADAVPWPWVADQPRVGRQAYPGWSRCAAGEGGRWAVGAGNLAADTSVRTVGAGNLTACEAEAGTVGTAELWTSLSVNAAAAVLVFPQWGRIPAGTGRRGRGGLLASPDSWVCLRMPARTASKCRVSPTILAKLSTATSPRRPGAPGYSSSGGEAATGPPSRHETSNTAVPPQMPHPR